nr:GSU2403 family nucleotidyltransferase fold protein [Chenggangzhangella methanolivorans]
MKSIGHIYQTLYSELAQRSLDARFASDFPADGRFVPVTVKDRKYWYFDRPAGDGTSKQDRSYVGPADDEEITKRVEAFKDLKADVRERRKIVSTLIREAYLPRPDKTAGDIVQALSEAGLFRLRGVLVGTVAYQAYSAMLGVRLEIRRCSPATLISPSFIPSRRPSAISFRRSLTSCVPSTGPSEKFHT